MASSKGPSVAVDPLVAARKLADANLAAAKERAAREYDEAITQARKGPTLEEAWTAGAARWQAEIGRQLREREAEGWAEGLSKRETASMTVPQVRAFVADHRRRRSRCAPSRRVRGRAAPRRRRTASSSRTSGADPGEDGDPEPPPPSSRSGRHRCHRDLLGGSQAQDGAS